MDHFNIKEKWIPANDVVFSIMFANRYLFQKLLQAVLGENAQITADPYSQVTMRESAQLNSIRFDVFSKDAIIAGTSALCSMDMQRSYWTKNIKRRVVYYAARSISTQKVERNEYQKLKPVFICFVMSEKADNESGIRQVVLSYRDTHDIFDDLLNLYLVYVPTIVTNQEMNETIYIFARFFTVKNNDDAIRFCEDFNGVELAEVLVRMYNEAVFDESILEVYSKYPYYTEREYLNDLESKILNIAKKLLGKGIPIGIISDSTGLDEELIEQLEDDIDEDTIQPV